jgi:hypothetical protein
MKHRINYLLPLLLATNPVSHAVQIDADTSQLLISTVAWPSEARSKPKMDVEERN